MEELIKKLGKLFDKYNVTVQEIAEVGDLIAGIGDQNDTEEINTAKELREEASC